MMYNTIIEPYTRKQYNIYSKKGMELLNKYIKGGAQQRPRKRGFFINRMTNTTSNPICVEKFNHLRQLPHNQHKTSCNLCYNISNPKCYWKPDKEEEHENYDPLNHGTCSFKWGYWERETCNLTKIKHLAKLEKRAYTFDDLNLILEKLNTLTDIDFRIDRELDFHIQRNFLKEQIQLLKKRFLIDIKRRRELQNRRRTRITTEHRDIEEEHQRQINEQREAALNQFA